MQAPFSVPPNYDTIAQRFSSQPDPLYFFNEKQQQESLQWGEYTEILHDITPEIGFYPSQYDVMLTDISHETLKQRISDELGIVYLSKATDDAKKPVLVSDGYIYGPNKRAVVPLVVSYNTSPYTYISHLASKKFSLDLDADTAALATIGGYQSPIRTSPSISHFPDVNVLGTDFYEFHGVRVWQDYAKRRAKLYIGGEWEVSKL